MTMSTYLPRRKRERRRKTKNEQERLGGLGPQDASAIGSALGYIAQRQPAWNTSQPTEAPSTQLEKFNEGETLIGEDGEKKEEVER